MKNSVLSIGNFDGLHLGHRKLLDELRSLARSLGLRSVVITYDNHPSQVLERRLHPLLLLPPAQKARLIRELGIDDVLLLHFDEDLAATSAEDFLRDQIVNPLSPAAIVLGYDSQFGHQRRGNYAFLQEQQERYGYELHFVEPLQHGNRVVSSTLIRDLLSLGELAEANSLLGAPYTLYGEVESGSGLGRDLGFPTANLRLEESRQLLPRSGVYLSRVRLGDGSFFGLTNIGSSPTLKHNGITKVETHILDFDQRIYGKSLRVELLEYFREEKMFAGINALREAMQSDLGRARKLIGAGLR
ncbi:MAG: bifunctional riboflavin kinase/FAD synthetase [Candidatus Cloacimonetes bacterium]|nr:bifunctional riboflavin kinase/FAD synthetase [Candidatus Cloacimonadota bacterium]MDD4223312.1 bifunctional riboflavin kinase/FAD synthetase [Candidatus Cloacimonadota bacterium]